LAGQWSLRAECTTLLTSPPPKRRGPGSSFEGFVFFFSFSLLLAGPVDLACWHAIRRIQLVYTKPLMVNGLAWPLVCLISGFCLSVIRGSNLVCVSTRVKGFFVHMISKMQGNVYEALLALVKSPPIAPVDPSPMSIQVVALGKGRGGGNFGTLSAQQKTPMGGKKTFGLVCLVCWFCRAVAKDCPERATPRRSGCCLLFDLSI